MYIILIAMSIIIILIGVSMIYNKKMTKKNGIVVLGTVINYEEYIEVVLDQSNEFIPVKVYKPTIEFTTYDNRKVRFVSDTEGNKFLKEGDTIPVVYSTKNPNDCSLLSTVEDLSLDFTIIAGGVVLFITAIMIYFL